MLASLVSLLRRSLRAIARRLPSKGHDLTWRSDGGVSSAIWTASDEDTGNVGAGGVSSIRLEIRPNNVPRLPFELVVSPAGYRPASFLVADLETARALALQQLAVARRLPSVGRAASEGAPDAPVGADAQSAAADVPGPVAESAEVAAEGHADRLPDAA